MGKILVVLLIGAWLTCCRAEGTDGAQAAVDALANCGGAVYFSKADIPGSEGKCFVKCLLRAIKVIKGGRVNWTSFEALIDDPQAKVGLQGCKAIIGENLDDSCTTASEVYHCVNSGFPDTFRDAYVKYFNTDQDSFKHALPLH
uniref:Salivary D7 secreted protein n=1 Tax=Simulium nigrimanum TaxID=683695 RepID=D1FPX8_SIMNI